MKRGETSGRSDDNAETIQKRFNTFRETSFPVIQEFSSAGKCVTVSFLYILFLDFVCACANVSL
jgi:UMP-CMP kinase